MGKLIYDTTDLTNASNEILDSIDKALMAAAFTIRDNARSIFKSDAATTYKSHTGNINKLSTGIMVGKNNHGSVKIHAFGSKDDYDSYKTRFFVGGTINRTQTKRHGKNIKPYTKGYIKAIDTIEKTISNSQPILDTYIQHVLDNPK